MPNWFFDAPIFVAFIAIYITCCSISIIGFIFAKRFFNQVDRNEVIGKVVWQTILFFSTLFITFWIATNIRNLDVLNSVTKQEAHQIENLYNAGSSLPEPYKTKMQNATLIYLDSVIKQEYPDLEEGRYNSFTQEKYRNLIYTAYKYTPNGKTTNELAYDRLLHSLDQLSDLRIQRLGLLNGELTGAFLVFFVLMISIGCFWTGCINSRNLVFTTIVIMSQNLVIASSSWLIFEIDKPFQGYFKVSNSEFVTVLNEINKLKF
jgi:hypothetical protein